MRKYGLITLLSLSCISHALAQEGTPSVDEYYKQVLEGKKASETQKVEELESIHASIAETQTKIKEIESNLQTAKPEELPALQIKLSLLQASLQMDSLKLQSAMVKANNTKTTEELHEEEARQEHKKLEEELKAKLESSNVRL
ncbi:uncharacterized membrane protein (DUF106 family) [Bartonella japonica]|uniref:Uncharacterized membrane protein (DUF106 family) n=1 Tax=Bartonella japonica TaxID=357761 RepID=A0ABV2FPK4_9HYPH